MEDPKILDELARRLSGALPPGMKELQDDLERTLRTAVQSALARLDLVTREEFDVQAQVLARTREKLEALSGRVEALEKLVLKGEETSSPGEQDMDGG